MCKGLPKREKCIEWEGRINSKNIIRVFTTEIQKTNVSLIACCMDKLPILPFVTYSS